MNIDARVTAVEAENVDLRERIMVLEEMLGLHITVPLEFGLTHHEAKLFGFLLTREIAPKESILAAVYGQSPDTPELKIIDVFVCKTRKKLLPHLGRDAIETVRGRGYRIGPETKKRVAAMLAGTASPIVDNVPSAA